MITYNIFLPGEDIAKKPSLTQPGDHRFKRNCRATTNDRAGGLLVQGHECSAVTHPSCSHVYTDSNLSVSRSDSPPLTPKVTQTALDSDGGNPPWNLERVECERMVVTSGVRESGALSPTRRCTFCLSEERLKGVKVESSRRGRVINGQQLGRVTGQIVSVHWRLYCPDNGREECQQSEGVRIQMSSSPTPSHPRAVIGRLEIFGLYLPSAAFSAAAIVTRHLPVPAAARSSCLSSGESHVSGGLCAHLGYENTITPDLDPAYHLQSHPDLFDLPRTFTPVKGPSVSRIEFKVYVQMYDSPSTKGGLDS
ncbi:hypothetical protein J6590_042520 [Homalodisca vitripennis]|nr:hypothetical protein J6590_042520 [Homalodisca vitripennis]